MNLILWLLTIKVEHSVSGVARKQSEIEHLASA